MAPICAIHSKPACVDRGAAWLIRLHGSAWAAARALKPSLIRIGRASDEFTGWADRRAYWRVRDRVLFWSSVSSELHRRARAAALPGSRRGSRS
jgi:hypothetical protein